MGSTSNSWRLRCVGAVDPAVIESSLETLLSSFDVDLVHIARHPGGASGLWACQLSAPFAQAHPRQELAWRRPLFEWAHSLELDLLLMHGDAPWEPSLVCAFDGDGTLFAGETIDEIAALAGKGEEVAAVTAAAMRGELDFEAALRARVRSLAGLPVERLREIDQRLPLQPGARAFLVSLREQGAYLALFTGGFHFFVDRHVVELGIQSCLANRLTAAGGVLTGELEGPIIDAQAKAVGLRRVCEQMQIPLAKSMACGDGANDLPMLDTAGLAIGFRPKPVLFDRLDGALFRGDWAAIGSLMPR